MAFDFPASPTDGQLYTPPGGPTYVYQNPRWLVVTGANSLSTVFVGDAPPASPVIGQFWWESDTGKLYVYFNDGDTSQWVEAAGGGRGLPSPGWRNRIINGDFAIDQRNNGASAGVAAAASLYTVDRWRGTAGQAPGSFAVQRIADPVNIGEYICSISMAAADTSITGSDYYMLDQPIEGYNVRDLNWGSALAKPITISFEVKGNAAYTLPLFVRNAGAVRTWLGSFSVTTGWTKVTLTVPGDVTGTWEKTNLSGMQVGIGLGIGPTYHGVAGWNAGNFLGLAGMSNFAGGGNTLQLRNFQLEAGSVATEFERVEHSEQLARCQRYYEKSYDLETIPGTVTNNGITEWFAAATYTFHRCSSSFRVSKRAVPTIALYSPATGAVGKINNFGIGDVNGFASSIGQNEIVAAVNNVSLTGVVLLYQWAASAEL